MNYALVFDFGGVLMKTATREPRWSWDDRLGVARDTVERVVHGSESWRRAQTGTLPVDAYWSEVATQLGIAIVDVGQLQRDYFSGDQLDTDIVAFIRARKAAGQRIAMLSNDSPALTGKLAALGIADLFDPLVISANIGVMKPSPDAYLYVIDKLGCDPEETVFIDDAPVNVEGARAVGMHAVLYTPEIHLPATLAPYLE